MAKVIQIILVLIKIMDSRIISEEMFRLSVIKKRRTELILQIINYYRITWSFLAEVSRNPSLKSCWKMLRHESFWEKDCQLNSESFFRNNFRMSRKSFDKLCQILKPMEKHDQAILLEKRIAIGLYALGSSTEYCAVANMFGVGKSTVYKILNEFCIGVWKHLGPKYLQKFPLSREQITDYVAGFEAMGYPQCFGAIDGCHIEIRPGSEDAVDYFNDKGWYSTILLALVDARYRFIYINIGSPGKCKDSKIFEKSNLIAELQHCSLLKDMAENIFDVKVPVHMIGDAGFPFSQLLMKPYPFKKTQRPAEKNFNYHLSKCLKVVENAFGQLKARFQRIGQGMHNNIENAPHIVKACCVLHNFLNEENDDISPSWLQAQEEYELTQQYPENIVLTGDGEPRAERIRKALSNYFQQT